MKKSIECQYRVYIRYRHAVQMPTGSKLLIAGNIRTLFLLDMVLSESGKHRKIGPKISATEKNSGIEKGFQAGTRRGYRLYHIANQHVALKLIALGLSCKTWENYNEL